MNVKRFVYFGVSKRLTQAWKWPRAKKQECSNVARRRRHCTPSPFSGIDPRYAVCALYKRRCAWENVRFVRECIHTPPKRRKVVYPHYVNMNGEQLSSGIRRSLRTKLKYKRSRPDVGSNWYAVKIRNQSARKVREARDAWLGIKHRFLQKTSIFSVFVGHIWRASYVDSSVLPYIKAHPDGWIVVVRTPSKRACGKLIDLAMRQATSFLSTRVMRHVERALGISKARP